MRTPTVSVSRPRLVALVAAMAAGAIFSVLFIRTEAFASDCPSDLRVIASPDKNGRGVRVGLTEPGMRVEDSSIGCGRASTLAVVNSAETRAVEIGWYEEGTDVTPCPQTSVPRVLRIKIFDGTLDCDQSTSTIPNTPQYDHFRVMDNNQDGIWHFYWEGNLIGTYSMGTFVTGDARALGERKSTHQDVARADHDGLYRMINATDWVKWEGTTGLFDSDPGYTLCIRSPSHVEVLTSC